jgi:hypothetical protein
VTRGGGTSPEECAITTLFARAPHRYHERVSWHSASRDRLARARACALLGLVSTIVACSAAPPRDLAWQVRFEDPTLEPAARALEAEIRIGGCAGTALFSQSFAAGSPPSDLVAPDLGPGRYGFAVTVRNASCQRYALGCAELDLPIEGGSAVVVTVTAFLGGPACPPSICRDGLCAIPDGGVPDAGPACPPGRGECNRDPGDGCETDLGRVESCGACDSPCVLPHATPRCAAGTCAIAECDAAWADCNGFASDGCETSLRTVLDCGACGVGCALANASETCATGRCEIAECHAGYDDCDTMASTGCEASLISPSDCGACATACADTTPLCGVDASGARTCVAACAAPAAVQCGSSCVDTATDTQHCGGCGTQCRADHADGRCTAGSCGLGVCDELFADCDTMAATGCEVSIASGTDCGGCGVACSSTSGLVSCAAGSCEVDRCFAGLGDCDASGRNGCEADLASPTTCGGCDAQCEGATSVCGRLAEGGHACLEACADPAPDRCGDRCYDTATDPDNCGGCGVSCRLDNASVVCLRGECRVGDCLAGFADCDGVPVNGCETRTSDNDTHCGGCGVACTAAPNATASCREGACAFECTDGFANCDEMRANGCETPVVSSGACGSCGSVCEPANASGECIAGTCRIVTCSPGFTDCDGLVSNGCEAQLAADPNHCGMCGQRCRGSERDCCGGMCGSCT